MYVQDKQVFIPGEKKEWKPSDPKDFVRFVMGKLVRAEIKIFLHLTQYAWSIKLVWFPRFHLVVNIVNTAS